MATRGARTSTGDTCNESGSDAERDVQFGLAQRGFTLVEVMVAIVILGIAIGSILLMYSNAIKGVSAAGRRSEALHGAEAAIAEKVAAGAASTADQLSIVFPGMDGISLSGKSEIATGTSQGRTVTITAFIPKTK